MPTQNHIQVIIALPETTDRFFVGPEYDPNQDTITGAINPGESLYPFASPTVPLAYPLVKFMRSISNTKYCVFVQVLPGYVFKSPEHDFLRITLYIDGRERVVRTVSAQQIVHNGSDRPYTIAIHGQGQGQHFYWKSIVIEMDDDAEPQDHDEWNYDLGSIQVYIHRMRAEEGEGSGEDTGDSDAVVDEKGEEEVEVDAGDSGCVEGEEDEDEEEKVEEDEDEEEEDEEEEDEEEEVEEDEDEEEQVEEDEDEEEEVGEDGDEEMEDTESEESGESEDEQDVILHRINVEERCLSHFTAITEPQETLPSLGTQSGECIDEEAFLVFDIKYRSTEMLRHVAVVPQ